ncbi:unnamed protein product, partial [Closterium sp. Naga37s-1]
PHHPPPCSLPGICPRSPPSDFPVYGGSRIGIVVGGVRRGQAQGEGRMGPWQRMEMGRASRMPRRVDAVGGTQSSRSAGLIWL